LIYLDTPNKKLEIVLAGAVATTQLQITSQYFDHIPQATTTVRRGAPQVATSNDTTDATIVSAPVLQGIVRNVHTIFVHNKDTTTATVTVKMDDSGTETIFIKQLLAVGESLTYEDKSGWIVTSPSTAPFVDTTSIVKGSGDASKQMRIEVDGLTAGAVRVLTMPDTDWTLFAAGTKMLFQQTSAPTGWTKSSTHNDKALRVVSGTVGSGGATAFTSVFGSAKTTGAHTLTLSEVPAHSHSPGAAGSFLLDTGGAGLMSVNAGVHSYPSTATTDSQGGGGSHDHTLSLDLQYVDVIVATKD
jgi:hypothetical protein